MKKALQAVAVLVIWLVVLPTLSVLAQGTVLADTGFRPQQNGFSFANYGNEGNPVNLTAATMQQVFGDRVCKAIQNGTCVLTATSQAWLDKINTDMAGGHCEGMAALSKLIYTGQVSLQSLDPNAQTIADLKADNPKVQAEIAKWFATQYVPPTATDEIRDQTPTQVVDTLIARLQSGTGPFTMGIYEANGGGGHAITPYSVVDMGNGVMRVMVYDNNYPGEERFIEVDRNSNAWKYTGSTNPNEPETGYSGNASSFSLTLTPATARTVVPQVCTFCTPDDGGLPAGMTTTAQTGTSTTDNSTSTDNSSAGNSSTDNSTTTTGSETTVQTGSGCGETAITTGPDTDLVVTTTDDKTAGVVNGQSFSNIKGAVVLRPRSQTGLDGDTPGAVVILPTGTDSGNVSMTVNGQGSDDVMVSSCGTYQRVTGLSQADGNSDTLVFNPAANTLTGEVDPDESLTLQGGLDNTEGSDLIYSLNNVTSGDGSVITVGADPETGGFSFESSGDATFDAQFSALDEEGNRQDTSYTDFSNAGSQGLYFDLNDAVYSDELPVENFDVDPAEFEDYLNERDFAEALFDDISANGTDGIDSEEVDGEEVDGEETDGEETDGEETDGEETDGEETDGEETDGEETDGSGDTEGDGDGG